MIKSSWQQVKLLLTSKGLAAQYSQDDNSYTVSAVDGSLVSYCVIPFGTPEQADFDANFKTAANSALVSKSSVQSQPFIGSKTIAINGVTRNLYARFTGIQATVDAGVNPLVINYTATYNWAKIIGVEVVNGEAGDYADFSVYDTAQGTYSGVPNALLNQFAYSLNIAPNFYQKIAQFDADLYAGMVIKITYTATGTLPRTIGINLLMNEVK